MAAVTTHPSQRTTPRIRRHRAGVTAIALALTGALALSACGDARVEPASPTPDPTTEPSMPDQTGQTDPTGQTDTTPPSLDGRAYLSTATTGFDLVEGTTVRLSFDAGQVGAGAGCNSMSGNYRVDGTTLVVGPLAMTEMGCEDARMAQDTLIAELLTSNPSVRVDGDTLVLTTPDRSISFLDREVADPDRPLEGTTWTLDTLISGDAAATVPEGVTATLAIVDGRARVATGCNTGGAAVTVDGDTIEFGPMALTKMACAPDAMSVEAAVTSVLGGTATFEIEAGRLTITSASPTGATTGLSFTAST